MTSKKSTPPNQAYRAAGVDIDAGNEVVRRIKQQVQSTYTPEVLSELGGFGGFFDLQEVTRRYTHPVLVQSIDGVGTKMIVARLAGKFDTIGADLVAACCNDIIVHGARPLTFLDYIANDRLQPAVVDEIVTGMAQACRDIGLALIGGETAEMPQTYLPGEQDLVGVVTGVVEHDQIITGRRIAAGDLILGLPSSGLHTNGYSLARKLFFEIGGYTVSSHLPELGSSVGETLLIPHRNYTGRILSLLESGVELKGLAHITGGGLLDNVPRILPPDCAAEIRLDSWPVPPVFRVMQSLGSLTRKEQYRTFNMGIGMVLVAAPGSLESRPVSDLLEIGRIVPGRRNVILQ